MRRGAVAGRDFRLRRCPACGFAFVADPWTDYDAIYDEAYYTGRGADPLVDYVFERERPWETIRAYEWRGIARAVSALAPVGEATRWLDYGCGTGGLVRDLRARFRCEAFGYEQGWAAEQLDVPRVERLEDDAWDVITAIEVVEHVVDPVALLARLRAALRPGGLLFLTTGNAAAHRDRLEHWRYVVPEIHVSFFEPRTLALALTRAGFRAEQPGFLPGHVDIIRFKVLKNLRAHRRSILEAAVPWPLVARVVDARAHVTAHPVGRA